jgi:hypothetical protein
MLPLRGEYLEGLPIYVPPHIHKILDNNFVPDDEATEEWPLVNIVRHKEFDLSDINSDESKSWLSLMNLSANNKINILYYEHPRNAKDIYKCYCLWMQKVRVPPNSIIYKNMR